MRGIYSANISFIWGKKPDQRPNQNQDCIQCLPKSIFHSTIQYNTHSLSCNISIQERTLCTVNFFTTLMKCCLFSKSNPLISLGITHGGVYDTWLQHVFWTPRGGLVIVHQNDIYHQPSPGEKWVVRVTMDGVPGVVFNGVQDWIYKGNIFN